jgi:hypothetical protein
MGFVELEVFFLAFVNFFCFLNWKKKNCEKIILDKIEELKIRNQ